MYCSPSTDSLAGFREMQHIVTELSLVSQYVVVAGDLNIDLCVLPQLLLLLIPSL